MENAVQIYAAVQFVVIGLSHTFQPRAWVDFFIWLRGKGHAGVFANGFLSLIFGSMIVGFHNVWTGWPTILTVFGWAQVIKALVSFVMPHRAIRGLERVSYDRAREFVAAGIVFLVFGAFTAYLAVT
ncbi:MAG TPA: hypothetical protein VJ650_03530 [Gemmatimonadaceae bacterium]|nr:hypothetical protein [Gemmatimonadaceae bacterium]